MRHCWCVSTAAVTRIVASRLSRVLDWGAGHGLTSKLLLDAGIPVTSLEHSDCNAGDRRDAERYLGVELELDPDPVRLPYEDASLDAVLSMGVLEHVADPEASLGEIHRVLSPGGALWVYKLPNRYSYLSGSPVAWASCITGCSRTTPSGPCGNCSRRSRTPWLRRALARRANVPLAHRPGETGGTTG